MLVLSSLLTIVHLRTGKDGEQPKIWVTSDNNLHISSAWDGNIVFRLQDDAGFNIDNVNVLDILHRHRIRRLELQNLTEQATDNEISLADIKHDVKMLYNGWMRFDNRLKSIENNTRLTLNRRIIRRILGRIRRLDQRITSIEESVLVDDCASADRTSTVCKNGGTCYDSFKSFSCDCTEGWTVKSHLYDNPNQY